MTKLLDQMQPQEIKAQILRELKQALQDNIPYAIDFEFPKFMATMEKALDALSLAERKKAQEAKRAGQSDAVEIRRVSDSEDAVFINPSVETKLCRRCQEKLEGGEIDEGICDFCNED
jgi:hypothetical protein